MIFISCSYCGTSLCDDHCSSYRNRTCSLLYGSEDDSYYEEEREQQENLKTE